MGEIRYLYNSKLIKLLKTSDKKELKHFEEYIISPFFNKNEEVVVFWKYIKKRLPDFEDIPTEKELLDVLYENNKHQKSKKWSPKEDTQLRVLMNRLTNLFLDFLVYQKRETEEIRNRRLLMDELIARKLHKMVPTILKTAHKIHNKNSYRDSAYYLDAYLIHEADLFIAITNNSRTTHNHPSKIINSLSNYTLSTLMMYYASHINTNQVISLSSDNLPVMDNLIKYIEDNKDTSSEIVIVFYHIYMMVSKKEAEKHYWELKEILTEFYRYLPTMPLRFVYAFMLNFCKRKIKKGEEKFRLEQYNIYQKSLPLNIWSTDSAFPANHYIQYIINALHLKKYDEVVVFQKEYQSKLLPKFIPDIPSLGYAYYHFHIGEYDKSQDYLNKVTDKEDFAYTLYYKSLLIKIYYEKQEWFLIESALEAFRVYLLPNRSKNISEQVRNHYKNFLNVCKKIVRQRNNAEYGQASINILKKVQQEIKDKDSIAERTWLLEKTEELITEETTSP